MHNDFQNCSYKSLRKFNYEYQIEDVSKTYSIDITSFIKNPYTYIKCRYFVELSTLIVYFLRKTSLSPNIVSLLTSLSAIIGGVLILSPNPYIMTLGLFFFFNGYVFDWCDGLLARVTGQSSITGKFLDDWSTHCFAVAFRLFIGLYVATHFSSLFFYLVPLVVFLSAINVQNYFQSLILVDLIDKKLKLKNDFDQPNPKGNTVKFDNAKDFVGKYLKYILFLSSFPDDRSRTIDFVCLLILIENLFNLKIVWLIFLLMFLKEFFRFIINILFVIRSRWCESKVEPFA